MKDTQPTGFKKVLPVFRDAFQAFKSDDVPTMAAALAYRTIFTIGPLLLLAVGIAGLFLSRTDIENSIQQQVASRFGTDALPGLMDFMNGTQSTGVGATVFGSLLLVWTASSLFVQIRDMINKIWEVEPEKTGLVKMIIGRLVAALLTIVLGVVIVAFLGLNVYLSVQADELFGGAVLLSMLLKLVSFLISIGIFTGLFMLLYRFLPSVHLDWEDVKFGAFMTAVLFVIGQYLISLYLAHFSPAGSFGAAGTLVVFILWVYLSGQIFFFGAEVTWAYSHRYGTLAEKEKVLVTQADAAVQSEMHPETKVVQERPATSLIMQVISGVAGLIGGIVITALTFPVAAAIGLTRAVKNQIRKHST
ncbi:YihY/virulence factor BrkB family protein [Deinococcus cellulosilyticus]|uniref:Uncharacterized protein n=1 Tax=Deinococcus cellulosilyticus (strain DSM 18568 / NBRC 106333 / KACC 11606 / 5516J-15) TaxID=1223518 RepID=A0A511MV72_DEIC1|nr:YihY/virulence factor BrkB family protein [Deinococcus cellulosilyticus]GEM44483.1 hypothetical protein DC3_01180 [Deinococcus cellulosilyticus NBRC 106333 = KACC 11606]